MEKRFLFLKLNHFVQNIIPRFKKIFTDIQYNNNTFREHML